LICLAVEGSPFGAETHFLRISTLRIAFRSRKLIHLRQHEIVEIPFICFEAREEISAFAERLFHGTSALRHNRTSPQGRD
jgi:hypothetical protein